MFWKRTIWKILFAIMVIAFLTIGGVTIYKAGFTQGAMAEISLHEDGDGVIMPHRMVPYAGYYHPRAGLFGFFPFLLCFGGFFFLMFAFGACRRAWYWKYAGKDHPNHWKQHGPRRYWKGPHWGPGHSPWDEDQSETESDAQTDGEVESDD